MISRLAEAVIRGLLILPLVCGWSTPAHAANVMLTGDDGPNVTLALHVGDRIRLRLPAQPSTGYRWSVTKRPSAHLLQLGSNLREDGGLLGGPPTQSYSWEVLQPGEDDLVLQYNRAFEPDRTAAKTYTLHVAAVPAWQEHPSPDATTVPLGDYNGQQPCADCSGIRVQLQLYAKSPSEFVNTQYVLKRTYQGVRDGNLTMVETGTWDVLRGTHADVNATVYQLRQSEAANPQNFAVEPGRLIPLDGQQIPLTGPQGMDLALHKAP